MGTLFVGIDGTRPDALLRANTPFIDTILASQSAYSFMAQISAPAISAPSWTSIHTGATGPQHSVKDNSWNFETNKLNEWPTIAARLRHLCPTVSSVAIVCEWQGWQNLCRADVDQYFALTDPTTAYSKDVLGALESAFEGASEPSFIFLFLDHVDCTGHASGFSPTAKEYLNAIERMDTLLDKVFKYLTCRTRGESWSIILTTDHGGTSHRIGSKETQQYIEQENARRATAFGVPLPDFLGAVDSDRSKLKLCCGAPPSGMVLDTPSQAVLTAETCDRGFHGLDIPQHTTVFQIYHSPWAAPGEIVPAPTACDVLPTVLFHVLCRQLDSAERAEKAASLRTGADDSSHAYRGVKGLADVEACSGRDAAVHLGIDPAAWGLSGRVVGV